ncbi:hypothetical protein MHK_007698 [Candidatus Magnetomorum sp. HK-1]|nr:hypothetical protein MHK_007698 [Candidatus Magnetomorum sp. HK-1]
MNILQVQNQLSALNSPVIKDLFDNYRNSMNILQTQNQLSVFNSSAIKDLFMSYKNSIDLIQAQWPFQDVIKQLKSSTFQSYLLNNIHKCINA